jgi:hypothetical protein
MHGIGPKGLIITFTSNKANLFGVSIKEDIIMPKERVSLCGIWAVRGGFSDASAETLNPWGNCFIVKKVIFGEPDDFDPVSNVHVKSRETVEKIVEIDVFACLEGCAIGFVGVCVDR